MLAEPLNLLTLFFNATFLTSLMSASFNTSNTTCSVDPVPITLVASTFTFCAPSSKALTVIEDSVKDAPLTGSNDAGRIHFHDVGSPVPFAVSFTMSPFLT